MLQKNISEIHGFYKQYKDPPKAPPTYSYLAPRVAFTFDVTRLLVQSHSPLIVCLVKTHLASFLFMCNWQFELNYLYFGVSVRSHLKDTVEFTNSLEEQKSSKQYFDIWAIWWDYLKLSKSPLFWVTCIER